MVSARFETTNIPFGIALFRSLPKPYPTGGIKWDIYKCRMVNFTSTMEVYHIQENTAHIITTKEKKPTW
jgi:hypothetical protein